MVGCSNKQHLVLLIMQKIVVTSNNTVSNITVPLIIVSVNMHT